MIIKHKMKVKNSSEVISFDFNEDDGILSVYYDKNKELIVEWISDDGIDGLTSLIDDFNKIISLGKNIGSKSRKSKDYDKLYKFICDGGVATGFVDYSFSQDSHVFRDVVAIQKYETNQISIGVRGICYGGVYPFEIKSTKKTEFELFEQDCKRLNLEWFEC